LGHAGSSTKLGAVPVCVVGFAAVSLSMTCAFCKACVAEDGFCAFRRVALHPPTTIAAAIKLQFTCLATTMDLLKCSEQSNRNEVIQTPHARDI